MRLVGGLQSVVGCGFVQTWGRNWRRSRGYRDCRTYLGDHMSKCYRDWWRIEEWSRRHIPGCYMIAGSQLSSHYSHTVLVDRTAGCRTSSPVVRMGRSSPHLGDRRKAFLSDRSGISRPALGVFCDFSCGR